MGRKRRLVAALAIAGTVLLVGLLAVVLAMWPTAPVAPLPYLTAAAMDLLPVAMLGALPLVLAALLARSHRIAIGLGLLASAGSVAVGMMSDATVANSAWSLGGYLVVAYWVGLVWVAAAGLSLTRALTGKGRRQSATTRGEQALQPDAPDVGA